MERFACAGVTRRPKDGARPVAFARSRSISLSPSPDKSEKKVVGIASNPYRVHQTEYIRRQYCTPNYRLSVETQTERYSLLPTDTSLRDYLINESHCFIGRATKGQ